MRASRAAWAALATLCQSAPAFALSNDLSINGASLSPLWMMPFAGILLSIALIPATAPRFWHQHFGKTSAFWALTFVVPFTASFGVGPAAQAILHTLLAEYIPFIILLFALFTVSGGIHVRGNLHGTPRSNVGLLALGAVLASLMGTTGASMLLIRPLLRANDDRRHRAHVVVFFIFIVANIGGALTPLGDPPLFLGFLKGVDFFWTTRAMLLPTLMATGVLLAMFYVLDRWLYSREGERLPARHDPTPDTPLRVEGGANFLILTGILLAVLMSGLWKPDRAIEVYGTRIELQNAARDVALLALAWLSWRFTPRAVRRANQFSFAPMTEVAKVFAGIFLTIIPAIAVLQAGDAGVLAPLVALTSQPDGTPDNAMYFWLTGMLSSFLDNAPTYLVFFNLAGGDPATLSGALSPTLTAISAGAVFMGANTYVGNAPNFMVKAIAESRGVRMPSFLAYFGWALLALTPVYIALTLLFFR